MSSIVGYISRTDKTAEYTRARDILNFQKYFRRKEWPQVCVQYPSIEPQVVEQGDFLFVAIGNVFKNNFQTFCTAWATAVDKQKVFQLLDGNFLVFVQNKLTKDIWLASDILATYPCYYTHTADGFYFASYLYALKEFLPQRLLDRTAFLQIIKFPYCLNQKTIYQGVSTLAYGSCLEYRAQTNTVKITPYLDYAKTLTQAYTREQTIAATAKVFEDEVLQRCSSLPEEHSFISGGTDARMIIAVLHNHREKLNLYTHNCGDENDIYCSKKIARAVGAAPFFESLTPEEIAPYSDRTILANDGVVFNLVASGYALLNKYKENIKEIYDGYLGGDIFGSHQPEADIAALGYAELKQVIYKIVERMPSRMFTPQASKDVDEIFQAETDAFFKTYQGAPNWFLADIFSLLQRQVRHVTGGLQRARTMVDIKTPYASYRLQQILFAMPAALRNKDKPVQKSVLKRISPLLYRQPECKVRYLGYSDQWPGTLIRYSLFRMNNLRLKLGLFSAREYVSDDMLMACFRGFMEKEIEQQREALAPFIDWDYYLANKQTFSSNQLAKLHLAARVLALYF